MENTQEVNAFDFVYQMLEKAHKKDFNGYSISESTGINNALLAIQAALRHGEAATKQLEQQNEAVKDVPISPSPVGEKFLSLPLDEALELDKDNSQNNKKSKK